ncbi:MAG TPA: alkaline phosphatase, partial [Planctomycetaceae bacterium]|nr:alkaline phosphatase [Planctomycetaceae bacterium]
MVAYAGLLGTIPLLERSARATNNPRFKSDPFTLGVASGDPDATSVVLWTRLAPEPLQPGGGMEDEDVAVTWELATDDSMRNIVASGVSNATVRLGHSVHVEANGLTPDQWYWYRFRAGDAVSPVGRTRTLPHASVMPEEFRFAFASCQNYEQGLFTAYEQMARDELDLVFHLGDYIY